MAHVKSLGVALGFLLFGCTTDDVIPKAGPPGSKADSGTDGGVCGEVTTALAAKRDACTFGPGAMPGDTIGACTGSAIPIEHVVILMQENRSFDSYFGHLPQYGQTDVEVPASGITNPAASDAGVLGLDAAIPDAGAPIAWHHASAYCTEDTNHGWEGSHQEWNGGKNDGFAIANSTVKDPTGDRALGYYDQTDLPFYYQLASTFAISDQYFCSLLGPTYPNRLYLAAGTSFGVVTTSITTLAPPGVANVYKELDAKGVTWKEYKTDLPTLLLFPDYASTTAAQAKVVDITEFAKDAAAGTLPQVSFVDPGFAGTAMTESDEHPPADFQVGQHFVWEQITAAIKGPEWKSTALFLTYDEHGGFYDHVAPPAACKSDDIPPAQSPQIGGFDQLGFRVPITVVSPYARRHFVSHSVHSHTSVLRFIEAKFDLAAMTNRDANSDAMLDFFDFGSAPDLTAPDLAEPPIDATKLATCGTEFPAGAL
ncbi:MAG TPA: alkaline phosphatase family protein [Polyangiaceae bacterium]|jgi:phospholipase C|nr:alkaline phosphatase family protein [Polyangiaceae bacterium]